MANELTLELKIAYDPSATNQFAIEPATFKKVISMTGADHLSGTQNIQISTYEQLTLGEITTRGICVIINLDSTNFVSINSDDSSTNPTIRINPGEFACFRPGQTNAILRGMADTATVNIQFLFFED